MMNNQSSSATATSSTDLVLPPRPAYGKFGHPVVLFANYFQLKGIVPETCLYRYSVVITSIDGNIAKKKKKRAFDLLLQTAPFSNFKIASDCSQTLVSVEKIPMQKCSTHTIVWYPEDGQPFPPPSADDSPQVEASRTRNTYQVLIEELGTVSLSELQRNPNYSLKEEAVQALNIIMSHGPRGDSNISVVAGKRFFPYRNHAQVEMIELGRGLQALRGYFSSVRTGIGRILVNVNVATSTFLKPEPLLESLKSSNGGGPPRDEQEYNKLARMYKKVRVGTEYLPNKMAGEPAKKRFFRVIHTLSRWGQNSTNVRFFKTDADGKVTQPTVQEHFQQAHNIRLAMPRTPLANCGTDQDPMWIPAELCFVIPGQPARRLLDPLQATRMIEFAARRPPANASSIAAQGLAVTKISPVLEGKNVHLSGFGINVNPNMITVYGRVLIPPQLVYRGQTRCTPQNGAWNLNPLKLGANPFRRTRRLPYTFSALVLTVGRRTMPAAELAGLEYQLSQFRRTLGAYGMEPAPLRKPCMVDVTDYLAKADGNSVNSLALRLENALRDAYSLKPMFLFVLLPSESAALYDSIKYICDCVYGIATVCSIRHKFSRMAGQEHYFANLAMKFNQKLGGTNHTVDLERLAPLDEQTIVFGIDVTHPSPGSSPEAPSIAGVVASTDSTFSQYPASLRSQQGRKEMVVELEDMVFERLQLWRVRNRMSLPNKVFVYRDGVSERQYGSVLEEECGAFKKAFGRLYGAEAKHPRMTLIVVGKRHHTRFYPARADYTDGRTGNTKPGTVVDRGMTGNAYDFFLVAHQGLQGTSRPAHYIVLKDENRVGADQMQAMTHNLCYTFGRATRAVSVCPPAYYADLVCERGRSYLQHVLKSNDGVVSAGMWSKDVHSSLVETMYYI